MKKIIKFGLSLVGPIVMIVILTMPIGPLAGGLGILQPIGGIFDVGRAVTEPTAQTVNLPGLTAQATVLVDQWGIPHIYASTVEDAYMALGYLHAKDRLFQMVIQNYLAEGRICELVGAYAASSDRFYRTIGLARAAQRTLDWYVANSANPDIASGLKVIDAECAGVNAFIKSMTSVTTPLEFKILGFTPQPWTRLDVFVWAKMMTWGLSGDTYDLEREWVRTTVNNDTMYNQLFTDVMPFEIPIVPEQTNLSIVTYPNAPGNVTVSAYQQNPVVEKTAAEALIPQAKLQAVMKLLASIIQAPGPDDIIGSNNWAVNGSKSTTGKPILCNDPHLGLQAPSLWYEAQIVVPGQTQCDGCDTAGPSCSASRSQ